MDRVAASSSVSEQHGSISQTSQSTGSVSGSFSWKRFLWGCAIMSMMLLGIQSAVNFFQQLTGENHVNRIYEHKGTFLHATDSKEVDVILYSSASPTILPTSSPTVNKDKEIRKWQFTCHEWINENGPILSTMNWRDTQGSILFHFSPRINEHQIVLNTVVSTGWGNEERLSLPRINPLVANVTVNKDGFLVEMSHIKPYLYRHRRPWSSFDKVEDVPHCQFIEY
jgi:hypothetical protein